MTINKYVIKEDSVTFWIHLSCAHGCCHAKLMVSRGNQQAHWLIPNVITNKENIGNL